MNSSVRGATRREGARRTIVVTATIVSVVALTTGFRSEAAATTMPSTEEAVSPGTYDGRLPALDRETDRRLATRAFTLRRDDGAEALAPSSRFLDTLVGLSGKLRARFVAPSPNLAVPVLAGLFGDSALGRPGILTMRDSVENRTFAFILMRPFSDKQHGRLGPYFLGNWPYERRGARSPEYENPEGFIEVTPQNQDTYISEHFRLRDFLTHDQEDVWPKYLVLNERLIDKLELVIADLEEHGVTVRHLAVMSGFRTPEYNRQGVGEGGRARASRHQYGDAADIFVDNNEDGRMDDINHDGRVDTRDARVIVAAVDRVEAAHPELAGGCGTYRATSRHGPFAHVDARGNRARWGRV